MSQDASSKESSDESYLLRNLKTWLSLLRLPFLTATALSMLLGTSIAWLRYGNPDPFLFALTMSGGILIHAGTNVSNDYFDHISGNDEANVEFAAPFTGGSRMIQEGKISPRSVLIGSSILFALAIIIGAILLVLRGPIIMVFGLIGLVSGFFYAAPPLKLASRGVGEPLVGLNFGVLLTLGAFYVQTYTFTLEPVLAALPVSFVITSVLWINEFPDYAADQAVGKRTLVVRLGKKKAADIFGAVISMSYVTLAVFALFEVVPSPVILGIATLPLSANAIRVVRHAYDDSKMIWPACASTVTAHLLMVTLMTLGYLFELTNVSVEWLFIVFSVMFLICTMIARKIGS